MLRQKLLNWIQAVNKDSWVAKYIGMIKQKALNKKSIIAKCNIYINIKLYMYTRFVRKIWRLFIPWTHWMWVIRIEGFCENICNKQKGAWQTPSCMPYHKIFSIYIVDQLCLSSHSRQSVRPYCRMQDLERHIQSIPDNSKRGSVLFSIYAEIQIMENYRKCFFCSREENLFNGVHISKTRLYSYLLHAVRAFHIFSIAHPICLLSIIFDHLTSFLEYCLS